jgi:SagB-type dehydrogenase family enzyme
MKNKTNGAMQPITLPQPLFDQCGTVFEALKMRRTCRSINDKKISLQLLSDILWAAQGVNRTQGPFGGPGLTAGSASNSQEIYIYVAMEEGIYLYEPYTHKMTPIATGDSRSLAIGPGQGLAGANAPVRLIYIVNIDKFKSAGFQEPGLYNAEIQKSYYFVDTGLIAQNVYLAASSLGLATWFHNCNKAELTKVLKLKSNQRALFGHSIGYADD